MILTMLVVVVTGSAVLATVLALMRSTAWQPPNAKVSQEWLAQHGYGWRADLKEFDV